MSFYDIPKHMLTSLSIDEMLLPIYMNWFTNFRDLSLRMEMALFLFKTHVLCFIGIYIEGNASSCLP